VWGTPPHGFNPRVAPRVLLPASRYSLLASGRRPITALTTADQENVDQLCLVFVRKLVGRAGLEPRISSFKLNRSQILYAHDLVRHEIVRHEPVRQY